MADISVVMDKLRSFETADELAEFFRGYGINAKPKSANDCVISRFVKAETGINYVSTTSVNILSYMRYADDETRAEHDMTKVMSDFIYRYDKGEYPDLIEN